MFLLYASIALPPILCQLATVYFDAVKKNLTSNFKLSERDSFLWQSNQVKHAMDFLLAIPIPGLNQQIGSRQFSAILCYRLGIPLFEPDSLFPFCKREMDVFGDHAVHCTNEVGLKFRHDLVRDTIADICYRDGVPARKEVDLGLLANNDISLRPTDVLVLNWDNGRDVCFDMTIVSPFAVGNGRTLEGERLSRILSVAKIPSIWQNTLRKDMGLVLWLSLFWVNLVTEQQTSLSGFTTIWLVMMLMCV